MNSEEQAIIRQAFTAYEEWTPVTLTVTNGVVAGWFEPPTSKLGLCEDFVEIEVEHPFRTDPNNDWEGWEITTFETFEFWEPRHFERHVTRVIEQWLPYRPSGEVTLWWMETRVFDSEWTDEGAGDGQPVGWAVVTRDDLSA